MRLSIVIPTLNEAASIERSILKSQDLNPFEIIVSDAASLDKTAAIAESAGAKVVVSRRGRGRQLNAGASVATGDVLLFLHADCWLESDTIEQIRTTIDDTDCAGGAFRQRIEHDRRVFRWLEAGNAARVRWLKLPYGDQGIFLRREVFEQLGGFADVPLMEDVLLMRELRRRNLQIKLLAGPLHVDPRRWLKYGVVRQTLRNWMLLSGFYLGFSPERLARFYAPHSVVPPE